VVEAVELCRALVGPERALVDVVARDAVSLVARVAGGACAGTGGAGVIEGV